LALSVAVHVTLVKPKLNVVPEAGAQTAVLIPDASEVMKSHDATAVGVLPLVGVTRTGNVAVKPGT
jgi:hypothetical protein